MQGKRKIGGWTVLGRLGGGRRPGGNARILRVTRDGCGPLALKTPYKQSKDQEPYRRFEQEVKALERLRGTPGVVEILEGHLPERPSRDDPGYYVMPIMWLARDVAAKASPEVILEGVRQVAATLAGIWETHAIAHRDLKPDNLFVHDGRWVVGDFGLVKVPEFPAITESGRKIGPTWYIAPELISPGREPNYSAADVYSLAKTLWVLLTGYPYPLPGAHLTFPERFAVIYSVSSYKVLPRTVARQLDLLLERATDVDPAGRPTMLEFADEVGLILHPEEIRPMDTPSIADVARRVTAATQERARKAELAEERSRKTNLVARELRAAFEPLRQRLQEDFPTCKVDWSGQYVRRDAGWNRNHPYETNSQAGGVCVHPIGMEPPLLAAGFIVSLSSDGFVYLQVGHYLAAPVQQPAPFSRQPTPVPLWEQVEEFPYGSARQEAAIVELLAECASRLPRSLEAFAELVERQAAARDNEGNA